MKSLRSIPGEGSAEGLRRECALVFEELPEAQGGVEEG